MQKKLNLYGHYCTYLRKSRADRDNAYLGEVDVLARHESMLTELAKRLGIIIEKTYREVVSGDTIAARPEIQKLLEEVEDGIWDGVLVVEVERLARGDSIDQGTISRSFALSHTLIITPSKIYDPEDEFDSEYFEFGLFMSRREYKTINRRLSRGRAQSAKEGKYIGNKPPYGYRRVKLQGEKGYTLEPVSEQANIVRMIFDMYVNGEDSGSTGVSRIVRKLNAMHIPPAGGKDWTTSTIQDMLSNPVYIGKIRYKWRPAVKSVKDGVVTTSRPRDSEQVMIYDGRHPGIIDPNIFNGAQIKRKKNPPRPVPTRYITQNPLSGIVICAKCGRKMIRRPYKPPQKDTLLCYQTNCPQVASPLYLVEQEILNALRSIVDDTINPTIALPDGQDSAIDTNLNILSGIEKQLDELHDQKERIYKFLEQGIYSIDVFRERSAHNAEEINKLQNTAEKMRNEIDKMNTYQKKRKEFIPKCEHLLSHYNELSVEQKNDCLKELIEKVVYDKNERNKRGEGDRPNFKLHLYPKFFSDIN